MGKILLIQFAFLLLSGFHSFSAAPDHKEADLAELSTCTENTLIPFKAKGDYFSVWDGKDYTKLFLKGMNLGIAVPGTLPGELAATSEQYARWFAQMKAIGYNNLRIYTLHFPRFYEELAKYNEAHPESPLLLFQGIWLDEQETDLDLYHQTNAFNTEIEEVIDCVHGNRSIGFRYGKAYGTYTVDVSPWVIGYIIGREVFPGEITVTNTNNSGVNSFAGDFLSISNSTPAEAWVCARMDKTVAYEYAQYATQRPVCFSSWPTLDPLTHPTETNRYDGVEDRESIDLSKVDGSKAEAGFFVSYHAYPYYPEFISDQPDYIPYSDDYGPNSYLGYLYDLKDHYHNIPLVIAEFGVPTSWGIAHLAQSKMHHGGVTEKQKGTYTIRMFENMETAGLAGGMQFSWLDEWFKQAWITNPLSDSERRFVWHNLTNPEQNFGVITFSPAPKAKTSVGKYASSAISEIKASADPTYFNLDILTKTHKSFGEDYWVALDTYGSDMGEAILPNGESITNNGETLRAEFALKINLADSMAQLFVTKAYDTYGIKLLDRYDTIISTVTDGEPWNEVCWKVNYSKNDIQYIGMLKISPASDPYSFLSPVSWNSDSITIKLPWTLINFRDPSQKKVTHYTSEKVGDVLTILTRDETSTGIAATVLYQTEKLQTSRYSWDNWDAIDIIQNPQYEREKQSVHYLKEQLGQFNSAPIANCETYQVNVGEYLETTDGNGLLANDFDYDRGTLEVVIPNGYTTMQGNLFVHPDGSFAYEPYETASGTDQFMYYVTDGDKYSRLVTATIQINTNGTSANNPVASSSVSVYPNPSSGRYMVNFSDNQQISDITITNSTGMLVRKINTLSNNETIDLNDQQPGIFFLNFGLNNRRVTKQLIKL
ncbi:MAG: T9SS type A sorting domain-containing protein [Mangrovibacterium sp.]